MTDLPTAILTSVHYSDLLSVTLPLNRKHFGRVIVATTPDDVATQTVCIDNNAHCLVTRAFYDRGAMFNKGAAVERCLEMSGEMSSRRGWIVVMDADIIIPEDADLLASAILGNLYTPARLMDRSGFTQTAKRYCWPNVEKRAKEEFAGFFQMFHASDSVLGDRPWYPTQWSHAGGSDSEFWRKWPKNRRIRPPFEVLHLGEDGKNWTGRQTPRLDGTFPPDAKRHAENMERLMKARDAARRRPGFVDLTDEWIS